MKTELHGVGPIISVLLLGRVIAVFLGNIEGIALFEAPTWHLLAILELPLTIMLLNGWAREGRGVRWLGSLWFPLVESMVAVVYFLGAAGSFSAFAYAAITLMILSVGGDRRGFIVAFCSAVATVVLALVTTIEHWNVMSDRLTWLMMAVLLGACSGAGRFLKHLLLEQMRLQERQRDTDVYTAAQAERLHLAREMHDTVTKTLAGTLLLARSLDRRVEDSDVADISRQVVIALQEACTESRALLRGLRDGPTASADSTCEAVIERFRRAYPVIIVDSEIEPINAGPSERVELARILGELLENVGRHSNSPTVTIRVRTEGDHDELTVADCGVGMDLAPDGQERGRPGHYGLAGVRERAHALGGTCHIESAPPRGTTIRVCVPFTGENRTIKKELVA